jgi:hypothetical protein
MSLFCILTCFLRLLIINILYSHFVYPFFPNKKTLLYKSFIQVVNENDSNKKITGNLSGGPCPEIRFIINVFILFIFVLPFVSRYIVSKWDQ